MTFILSGCEHGVAYYEMLAESDPDRYVPRLAWALTNLGSAYGDAGDPDVAVSCYADAASLVRGRVDGGIAAVGEAWDLQQHLFNLASISLREGHIDGAKTAIDELFTRLHGLAGQPCPLLMGRSAYVSDARELRERIRRAIESRDGNGAT